MTAKGSGTQERRLAGREIKLWVGSALVGLLSFALAWGLQSGLIHSENYTLQLLQATVAFNGGMTQHAYQSLKDPKRYQPITVVEIGKGTYDWVQTTDFSKVPGSPFTAGRPARLQVYQRWFHTQVLRNLKKLGARVVVFDIVFSGADPELDADFARAIKEHGKVVLAAVNDVGQEAGSGMIRSKGLDYPSGELLAAAAGLGMATLPQDADEGTLRRFQWGTTGIDYDTGEDTLIPALGAAAAALYEGRNPKTVLTEPENSGRKFLGHRVQAISGKLPERLSYITYFGPSGQPAGPDSVLPYESLVDLDHSTIPLDRLRAQVKDRIIIIGSAAASDQDVHRVPVKTQQLVLGATQKMPGVEVQSHVVQTLLSGQYVEQATDQTQVLLLLFACLFVSLSGRVLNPRSLMVIGALLVFGLCWGSTQLLGSARLWMEPVTASVGVLLATIGETTFMYVTERRARLHVRRQLQRQVGPGVADKLTEGDWPEFGGEAREITLFFSDLQGFTSLSENMSSPEICQFLNRYCGVILPILDEYGGALDKIMGDGFMAYFGWVPRHPDHAARAIQCALKVQQALDEWTKLPENQGLPPLRTRVGLHTGIATVGEIGAAGRAEFTVIGDIVNVASRLEGMNKEFGTRILLSEATRDAAGDIVPMQYRGVAQVRGREVPMPVYSVDVTPDVQVSTVEPEPAVAPS
jgi:adenylate cyclase